MSDVLSPGQLILEPGLGPDTAARSRVKGNLNHKIIIDRANARQLRLKGYRSLKAHFGHTTNPGAAQAISTINNHVRNHKRKALCWANREAKCLFKYKHFKQSFN